MATIPWLIDVLRAAGVEVVEHGDWRNRMRPGSFNPIGVLWHHTAATSSATNPHPALNVCINGRSDLPGPLCQALVDYHGRFHLISAGRCNHAGTARASGPIPAGDGNTMLIGWEIDYNGVSQQMTAAQYSASVKATAAVLERLGRDASYARGHKETSVTGKIDPSFIDLNVMRADVAAAMAGPPAVHLVGDWNGDGRTDVGIYRPSSSEWKVPSFLDTRWGGPGDIPVPGKWNGNGRTYAGVFRPSTGEWLVPGVATHRWGGPGDIPVPADYNGDGRTDLGVFRPSSGDYLIPGLTTVRFGGLTADAIPVPADYNGDRRDEPAMFDRGTWYLPGGRVERWGGAGDIPVPGDWNGNGRADIAVWRPSTGEWLIPGWSASVWGGRGDIPVPRNHHGGTRVFMTVFRPSSGEWLTPGVTTARWGGPGDIPIGTVGNAAIWRQLGISLR